MPAWPDDVVCEDSEEAAVEAGPAVQSEIVDPLKGVFTHSRVRNTVCNNLLYLPIFTFNSK